MKLKNLVTLYLYTSSKSIIQTKLSPAILNLSVIIFDVYIGGGKVFSFCLNFLNIARKNKC